MATKFVRVTTPSVLFDLWVAGLMYKQSEGYCYHCEYGLSDPEEIELDRAHYLPAWEKGEGVSFDDQYGYMEEE